jgi:flavin reductase (DIM6/NTAB) family NADH-FMN oxidoreductase RutF
MKKVIYPILLALAVGVIVILLIVAFGGNSQTSTTGTMENIQTTTNESPSGEWRQISPQDIADNAVKLFNDDWMALAAGREGDMNAMTISWGSLGELWNKPVVTVYVSPDRYTDSFMERNDYFTVTAFAEEHRPKLLHIGSHSGRDGDKLKDAGLAVEYTPRGNPMFTDGRLMIECRKIYSDQFDASRLDSATKAFYAKGTSIHNMYIGEIVNVWVR